ncbi:MAG: cytochrome b N-terminal domain-containing protein [Chloroflexi bacterium]|nr:cytochrome b N-terminal domain-containing protein [Chloroflexota bacterium]
MRPALPHRCHYHGGFYVPRTTHLRRSDLVEAQTVQTPPGKVSLLDRIRQSAVWRSIFRQGYPDTDENRALVTFNTFFLHLHPVKIKKHTIKVTYTWGLGIISAFLFALLTVTGIVLMFLYIPSVNTAYQNMVGLETSVTFGMLLRNLHRWGAHLMVLVVFLHMCRVFFTSGYKQPREFNWALGVILWVLTLLLSFTGYLLPWDQLAYWAITIASNIAGYVPVIGEQAKFFLLGAATVGQGALLRFYALHVIALPALMTVLIAIHLWRIRKDGGLSAPAEETEVATVEASPVESAAASAERIYPLQPEKTYGLMALMRRTSPMVEKGPSELFSWPHLLVMEGIAVLSTTLFLLFISFIVNAPLRDMANPAVTEDPAKAPWFFSSLQEVLLHMNPTLAGFFVPVGVILVLMALPYFDRDKSDVGIWFGSKRGKSICLFSAIYTTVAEVGLVIFDGLVQWQPFFGESQLLRGWIVPLATIGVLMVILRLGLQRWHPTRREVALGFFTAFVVTYIVLTISTQFFRGSGMHLMPVWQLPPGGLTF